MHNAPVSQMQMFPSTANSTSGRMRLEFMDDFRGFAILLIVLGHVYPSSFLPLWGLFVFQNASVFFIFISGFFVRYLYRESESILLFFRRKIVRIVVPYMLSCMPGLILVWQWKPELRSLEYFASTIYTGVGHFSDAHWYMPFIFLVFAAYPVWRFLIRHDRMLVMTACIGLLISLVTFRSHMLANPLINFVHYAGVFVAGILAARHCGWLLQLFRRQFWLVVTTGIFAWALAMPFAESSFYISMEQVLVSGKLQIDVTLLTKLFLVLPLMAIFLRLSDFGRSQDFLRVLAGMSFGIFFWHGYAIVLVDYSASRFGIDNVYWSLAFRPFLVFLLVVGFLIVLSRLFPRLIPYLGMDASPATRLVVAQ